MEPEQANVKVAVLGMGGDGVLRSLKRSPDLEGLIAQETGNMTTEDYFAAVAALYRSVVHIANSIASMPRQFENVATGNIVAQANFMSPEKDETGKLLDESNLPIEVRMNRLLWRTTAALQLDGQAFWHKERNLHALTGVKWQDPRLIKPIRTSAGIVRFEKKLNGRRPIPIDPADMVYHIIPGLRENDRPGISPAQVAMNDAGFVYHQGAFLNRFFENGAMPTTLFFYDGQEPSLDERNRMKRFLYRAITGRLRAWGIEFLSNRLKFQQLTPPIKDMVLPNQRTEAEYAICVAMGVPISVIYTNASRNSTSEQDDIHFYTKTAVPLARDLEETANEELWLPLGLRMRFRPDKLEVFEALEAAKLQNLSVVAADLTSSERRAAAGYPVLASGNGDADPDGEEDATKRLPLNMTPAEYELMKRDLALWETKVLKRYGRTHPVTIRFDSAFIPAPVSSLVRNQLQFAQNGEEIRAAFAAPFRLFRGPRTSSPPLRRFTASS